jgi:hypothetical protein
MKFSRTLISLIAVAPASAFMASPKAVSSSCLRSTPAPFFSTDIAEALDREVSIIFVVIYEFLFFSLRCEI